MSRKTELTPLPKVTSETDRIVPNIAFPEWLDENQIGLDIKRTLFAMNLGGINRLYITRRSHTPKESGSPMISGVDQFGNARAAWGAAKQDSKTSESSNNSRDNHSLFQNFNWTAATILLNLGQVEDSITQQRLPLRKPESWTPQLDAAIRKGIGLEGFKHLLVDQTRLKRFFSAAFNLEKVTGLTPIAKWLLTQSHEVAPPSLALYFVSYWLVSPASMAVMAAIIRGIEKDGKGYRLSLFPGFELDRVLLQQLYLLTKPLVKKID